MSCRCRPAGAWREVSVTVRFGPCAGMCGAEFKEGNMANTNSKPGSSHADGHEPDRRDFIVVATYAMGAVGAAAVAWPLIDQMNPDASVKALASTEVDVSLVEPGNTITVLWRGKPVFIRRRTQDEISEAKAVKMEELKHPEKDEDRAKNPEWLVMLGVCTHLGCVPLNDKGDYGAWFCPCHGSHYDTSGRIRKGPAPTNMEVPKYEFVNSNTIKIG